MQKSCQPNFLFTFISLYRFSAQRNACARPRISPSPLNPTSVPLERACGFFVFLPDSALQQTPPVYTVLNFTRFITFHIETSDGLQCETFLVSLPFCEKRPRFYWHIFSRNILL
jgi:hypothetical protein